MQIRKKLWGWPHHQARGVWTQTMMVRTCGVIPLLLTVVGRGGLWVIPGGLPVYRNHSQGAAMTDEKLLELLKEIDPLAVRVPSGMRAIADAIEAAGRARLLESLRQMAEQDKERNRFDCNIGAAQLYPRGQSSAELDALIDRAVAYGRWRIAQFARFAGCGCG